VPKLPGINHLRAVQAAEKLPERAIRIGKVRQGLKPAY